MAGFQVDVVATPRLDLCGAAARDLSYREANGKYPAPARSQMAKEQEKLNKFLQYVNESFIIKGFAKTGSASGGLRGYSSGNSAAELWQEQETTVGTFTIPHGDGAQIAVFITVTGDGMSATSTPAVLTLHIRENGGELIAFRQAVDGYFTMSAPFLLSNRSGGTTQVEVAASVSGGEVYVDSGCAYAQALLME
ncbi:MAG: hypothetical protein ACI4XW_14165 [Candidatus Spyradocola sp.]